MSYINELEHRELINILEELLDTIKTMQNNSNDYILLQNGNEAKAWLQFLKEHNDKDELRSLEIEISDRFFYKFDVEIEKSELDNKRVKLIRDYILRSNEFLNE